MQRIRIFIASLLLTAPLFFASTNLVLAATQADQQVFGACNDPALKDQAQNSSVCKSQGTTSNPATHIINVAAAIVASLTGVGAVIMIIIGGFSYVTAGGSAEQAANARRRILYSVVALVVVALAWAVTRFITDRVIQ